MKSVAQLAEARDAAIQAAHDAFEAGVAERHAVLYRDFFYDGEPTAAKFNPVELTLIADKVGGKTSPAVPIDKTTKVPLGNQDLVDFLMSKYQGDKNGAKKVKTAFETELATRAETKNRNTTREG